MASPLLSTFSDGLSEGAATESGPLLETPAPTLRNLRDLKEDSILTRALRSHQLWLTLTYLGLLVLMGRGLAG